jgi:hypothetical protein
VPEPSGLWCEASQHTEAFATKLEPTLIAELVAGMHESSLALKYHTEGASRVPSDGVLHQLDGGVFTILHN